jgi:hypothetical protein
LGFDRRPLRGEEVEELGIGPALDHYTRLNIQDVVESSLTLKKLKMPAKSMLIPDANPSTTSLILECLEVLAFSLESSEQVIAYWPAVHKGLVPDILQDCITKCSNLRLIVVPQGIILPLV